MLLVAACGSNDDDGSGGSLGGENGSPGGGLATPIQLEDLPAAYAAALCNNITGCCQQAGVPHDPGVCRTTLESELDDIIGYVDSNAVEYNALAAGACVEAIAAAAKSCDFNIEAPVCDEVFIGKKPEGAACNDDLECTVPSGGDADCEDNVCVVEKRGKQGDACDMTCEENESSTVCMSSSDTPVVNVTCYRNDGLYCGETCKPLIAEGGSGCGWDSMACADGNYAKATPA